MPDNLPAELTFYPWNRPNIFQTVPAEEAGKRLKGTIVGEVTDGSTHAPINVNFELIAPADIAGFHSEIIVHTAPKANETNVETTKLVHIDFRDADFAWRYTPKKEIGASLAPWLVLLVGTVKELRIDNDEVTVLDNAIFVHYPLDASKLWAHVQHDGPNTISRLLSPYPLPPQSELIAAVVPAFDENHLPMWDVAANRLPSSLPVFYWWRFWTGEAGDFETLARALRMRDAAKYKLGKAPLHYHRNDVNGVVNVHGAITMIQQHPPDEPDLEQVQTDLAALKQALDMLEDDLSNPEGIHRKVISLPTYGRPWTNSYGAAAPNDWAVTLNTDPRFRGSGGIGLEMGIRGQEKLVDAAVQQLGAIDLAAQKVRNLALGLMSGGSLWARHLPQDSHAQLITLSPLTRRMRAANGSAMSHITQADSPLTPAMFSSAARRVLRPGTARTLHSSGSPLTITDFLKRANTCPETPTKPVDGLLHIDDLLGKMDLGRGIDDFFEHDVLGMKELPEEVRACIEALAGKVIDFNDEPFLDLVRKLDDSINAIEGCELQDMYLQEHNGEEVDGKGLYAAVRTCFEADWRPTQDVPPIFRGLNRESIRDVRELVVDLIPEELIEPCNPPDIDHVVSVIAKAVDPRGAQPPAWRRVAALIHGIDLSSLAPPEIPIGIHFPTWTLLNEFAKEWLLPGIGNLPKDSIVALQTNPAFIDAYMVGINQQYMDELHWRNISIDRTCTPLLMFWGHIDFVEIGDQSPDIKPIRNWNQHTDLGDNDHQVLAPGDAAGKRDLVVIFRTDLFRRYPRTLVYLVNPDHDNAPDDDLKATPNFSNISKFLGPIFQGELEPDVVFFAFNIDPTTLDQYWLILDEPPSELRFRNDILRGDDVAQGHHGAHFASKTIDTPTRVAFDGGELETLGSEYD